MNVVIDDLSYGYNGNQLIDVKDDGDDFIGFADGSSYDATDPDYEYDANGNLISDDNKGITNIIYNHLNLPESICFGANCITFLYDANGTKLRKTVSTGVQQDYLGGIEYTNGAIDAIYHEEGRATLQSGVWQYEYYLKDHLGNTRVIFTDSDNNGEPEIIQEADYYPFGMRHQNTTATNHYLYNGKELNTDLGLDWYDYGARWLDVETGRWSTIDPLAENYASMSPFNYVANNPIIRIDPDGRENIAVVGSQNETGAGNKLMFVNQALRSMRIWAKEQSNETRTMVLFTEGYSDNQITAIAESVSAFGGHLVLVNSSQELTNYLNSGEITSNEVSEYRINDKITDVDIYAHGIVGSIEFGYETPKEDVYRFNTLDAESLNSSAFQSNGCITSYACRTGLGNSDIYGTSLFRNPNYSNSLAKQIADNSGVLVRAFAVRTSYVGTLGNAFDRRHNNPLYPLPTQRVVDGAAFTPKGSNRPVTGGSTPIGLPRSIMSFYREKNKM